MRVQAKKVILLHTFLAYNLYTVSGNTVVPTEKLPGLFKNYSSIFKPRKDLSQSVLVNITFHLKSISEINERLQTMRFIAWFAIRWVDEFLILSDDVESLLIPKDDIWYPDISMYEAVDDPQTISDGKHVILFQNGHVAWYPGDEYTIRCVIDIRRYPFDVQLCNFQFGPWLTTIWTQRLMASEEGLELSDFIENGEWEITKTTVEQITTGYNNSLIEYNIYLKRRHLHPVLNTLLPVIMLSFLNTLVFLLPAHSGEKMTLCISVLLSFTVFLTVFNDTMPKMSTTISYLSIYLVVQLGMSVFGIVMTILIWRMDNGKNKNYTISDLVENKSNKYDKERNDKTIYTNNGDIGNRRLSLNLPEYTDGIEGNIPIGGDPTTVDNQGEETEYHVYRNTTKGDNSTVNKHCRPAMFPSLKHCVGYIRDKTWSTEQLDVIMFTVTLVLVLGSTIVLFVALLL